MNGAVPKGRRLKAWSSIWVSAGTACLRRECTLFGVFDGHGGEQVARFAVQPGRALDVKGSNLMELVEPLKGLSCVGRLLIGSFVWAEATAARNAREDARGPGGTLSGGPVG